MPVCLLEGAALFVCVCDRCGCYAGTVPYLFRCTNSSLLLLLSFFFHHRAVPMTHSPDRAPPPVTPWDCAAVSRVGPLKSVEASVGAAGYVGPQFLGRSRVHYTATVWLVCGGAESCNPTVRTAPCCNREGEITARAGGRGTVRRRVLFVHGGARGLFATSPFIICMMFCLGFCLSKANVLLRPGETSSPTRV